MTQPIVSIITACKLRTPVEADWLTEAYQSLLAQDVARWEWVVVDDHSDVAMPTLPDARVKVIPASAHGVSSARNQAAEAATSELLYPLDADDKLASDCLHQLLRAWVGGGSKQGIVYPSVTMFGGTHPDRRYTAAEYDFEKLLRGTYILVGSLHRKLDWKRVGGWKPALESGLEDWEYWIALGECEVYGFPAREAMYYYRRNPNGRLARLRSDITQWGLSHKKMMDLHADTYKGEKKMACCGGNRRAPEAPAAPANNAPAVLVPGETGMVALEYLGQNVGTTLWYGPTTHLAYSFGNNVRDRVKYVDSRDVDEMLAIRDHRMTMFKLFVPPAPPTPPAPTPPAPEPEPEPVVEAVKEDTTTVTVAELLREMDGAVDEKAPEPEPVPPPAPIVEEPPVKFKTRRGGRSRKPIDAN